MYYLNVISDTKQKYRWLCRDEIARVDDFDMPEHHSHGP